MLDFGAWFNQQGPIKEEKKYFLPENVDEMKDGTFTCYCCCCDRLDEVDPSWFTEEDEGTHYNHYCGGSPSCCP